MDGHGETSILAYNFVAGGITSHDLADKIHNTYTVNMVNLTYR